MGREVTSRVGTVEGEAVEGREGVGIEGGVTPDLTELVRPSLVISRTRSGDGDRDVTPLPGLTPRGVLSGLGLPGRVGSAITGSGAASSEPPDPPIH